MVKIIYRDDKPIIIGISNHFEKYVERRKKSFPKYSIMIV